jgi:hypothetical protein
LSLLSRPQRPRAVNADNSISETQKTAWAETVQKRPIFQEGFRLTPWTGENCWRGGLRDWGTGRLGEGGKGKSGRGLE